VATAYHKNRRGEFRAFDELLGQHQRIALRCQRIRLRQMFASVTLLKPIVEPSRPVSHQRQAELLRYAG